MEFHQYTIWLVFLVIVQQVRQCIYWNWFFISKWLLWEHSNRQVVWFQFHILIVRIYSIYQCNYYLWLLKLVCFYQYHKHNCMYNNLIHFNQLNKYCISLWLLDYLNYFPILFFLNQMDHLIQIYINHPNIFIVNLYLWLNWLEFQGFPLYIHHW